MIAQILNRRFALISAMTVLGAVSFAPKASADSVNIEFNGNVPSVCTFSGTTGGTLTANQATRTLVTQTAGETILTCNSDVRLRVDKPVVANPSDIPTGANLGDFRSEARLGKGNGNGNGNGQSTQTITSEDSSNGVGTLIGRPNNQRIRVSMTAVEQDAEIVLPGEYKFTVRLTATAN